MIRPQWRSVGLFMSYCLSPVDLLSFVFKLLSFNIHRHIDSTQSKVSTKPTVATTSPPVIHCPCSGGACDVLTSKTEKNPNRRFYKCSAVPSCGFFKWRDQVCIIKSESISVHPTCPCGSGPCRRVTVINVPNAQRSYFVCSIKKSFGACGFFKWEDDVQIQPESEQQSIDGSHCSTLIGTSGFDESLLHETYFDSDGNVKRSRLGVGVGSDLNSTLSNEFHLGNRVVDGIVESVKDTFICSQYFHHLCSVGQFGVFMNQNIWFREVDTSVLVKLNQS